MLADGLHGNEGKPVAGDHDVKGAGLREERCMKGSADGAILLGVVMQGREVVRRTCSLDGIFMSVVELVVVLRHAGSKCGNHAEEQYGHEFPHASHCHVVVGRCQS